jgi:hypothetical protein
MTKRPAIRAVDGIQSVDNGNFRERLIWHPTDHALDKAHEGDCICNWCITNESWILVAEGIDVNFAIELARLPDFPADPLVRV